MATIKINMGYDENTNTHYYRNFEIKEKLPVIGEVTPYEETVALIKELPRDICQPTSKAYKYRCFKVYYRSNYDESESEEFIAVSEGHLLDGVLYDRAVELYNYLDLYTDHIADDWDDFTLTLSEGRDKKEYLWYLDHAKDGIINVLTGEICLDEDFIDKILC